MMIDLEKIPKNPGVYLMKDNDEILYIGKAKNLNKRVKQYFDEKIVAKRGPKIIKMVSLINDIEFIATNTETEALILENNLIKEHKPRYNTLLLDDKTYPYVRINISSDYPEVEIVRQISSDKAKYFGPYPNDIATLIDKIISKYQVRHCSGKIPNKSCIYNQMHICMGPCINDCKTEYKENIQEICDILNGKTEKFISELEKEMNEYSEKLEFEKAASIRDTIKLTKKVINKQIVENGDNNLDIIGKYSSIDKVVIVIFNIRHGKIIAKKHFTFDLIEGEDKILNDFTKRYYLDSFNLPNEIVLENDLEDEEVLLDMLKNTGNKIKITHPQKGKKKDLLNLVNQNAKLILSEDERKKTRTYEDALNEIGTIIDLEKIGRIESYDISNTSGVLNVASMVVFNNGFNYKKYRKFKLETKGPDDYKCMQETIRRRFTDEKLSEMPDLILIDGGKGQVNAVLEILDDLDKNIKVCGMVKDDNHRTRGLFYEGKEYKIEKSFNLITQIQDNTHNFAINYHRNLRSKNMTKSVLDDIPTIGPMKRNILLKNFKSVEKIKEATFSELTDIPGISETNAMAIIKFFLGEDEN
jgi:excinuclease ABC subunit C